MATSANNSFTLTGYVATEARVNNFEKSAVARFALSVNRTEGKGENATRKSALINCECWRSNGKAQTFDLIQKRKLVKISGFIRPEEWTDKEGAKHNGIVFVATSIEEFKPAAEKAPAEEKKAPKGKKSKKDAA